MKNLFRYYVHLKKERHQPGRAASQSPFLIRVLFPLIGLLALVWFLVRVIPKPSRATYPCQRIAFPLASSFVIWLIGLLGALSFLRQGQRLLGRRKYLASLFFVAVGIGCIWLALTSGSSEAVRAAEAIANSPLGEAKGIFPGRVVWVHDPNATSWVKGDAGYSWQPAYTSQTHVDAMVGKAIRQLTGEATDGAGWDAMFRYFNIRHGKGDIGYTPGEKITIKVNLTTCNYYWSSSVDPETYDKTSFLSASDSSPQMILSLLRQLVCKCGVDPNDIAVGDTTVRFPNQWYDYLQAEFPDVVYFDGIGGSNRTQSVPSTIQQYWSDPNPPAGVVHDYIPALYAQAEYLVNLPVLKGHGAGITLCAKNHYGSYNRIPVEPGYYDLHGSLASASFNPAPQQYRALVDMMGHPHMGGKTLLYLMDGLYGGYRWQGTPYLFENAPFDHDWPSSVLASLDPVAIDSVGLDILWDEWPDIVQVGGVDDYLIEAALADNPPSGVFYDPDGDGIRLESLGVHERWNNSIDRQYSRNLDPENETGIELVYIRVKTRPGDLSSDGVVGAVDLMQLAEMWLWLGQPGQVREDLYPDGTVDLQDFMILSTQW